VFLSNRLLVGFNFENALYSILSLIKSRLLVQYRKRENIRRKKKNKLSAQHDEDVFEKQKKNLTEDEG
jgi:hypothetical protein